MKVLNCEVLERDEYSKNGHHYLYDPGNTAVPSDNQPPRCDRTLLGKVRGTERSKTS